MDISFVREVVQSNGLVVLQRISSVSYPIDAFRISLSSCRVKTNGEPNDQNQDDPTEKPRVSYPPSTYRERRFD